ncbi:hypothetical protein STEG23_027283 [Scotinomys teguina]
MSPAKDLFLLLIISLYGTLEDEFSGGRLQKLEQQRQLLEKKQRWKRQELLMVRANPDASLRHRRRRRRPGENRFQRGCGCGSGIQSPLLQENVPQARLPSWTHSAQSTMSCVGDGSDKRPPQLSLRRAGTSEEEGAESKDAAIEHKAPSPAPAPIVNSTGVQGHVASCEEEGSPATKDIEGKPASDLGNEDLEKKEGSEASQSTGTDKASVTKVLQGNGNTCNDDSSNWIFPLACTPGPPLAEDREAYMLSPAPPDCMVQCRIIRYKHRVDKGLYPSYYLYQEGEDGIAHFLLTGQKKKRCKTSNYIISLDRKDMSSKGKNFVGKVRSNVLGTKFTIFDNGVNPERNYWIPEGVQIREKLGVVRYVSILAGAQRNGGANSFRHLLIQFRLETGV